VCSVQFSSAFLRDATKKCDIATGISQIITSSTLFFSGFQNYTKPDFEIPKSAFLDKKIEIKYALQKMDHQKMVK